MGQGRKHGQWSYRLLESHNSPDIKSLVKEERRLIQLSLRRLHPFTPPVVGRVKRGLKGQKGILPMVYYTIIYNIGNNFRLQEASLQTPSERSSLKTSRPKNLLFLLANGQEKGGMAETEDRIPTYKICRQQPDGIFSKETSILC